MSQLEVEHSADQQKTSDRRIPVAVLGATGSVGQRCVQLLEKHPWFRIHELVASERSAGKTYRDAAGWRLDTLMPDEASLLDVKPLYSELESKVVFSGLDSSVAGEAEDFYADHGAAVISNSKNHRMDPDVPLLIPEINAEHIAAIDKQRIRRGGKGFIATNPNCSTIGIAMALAPIQRRFGIALVNAVTMQAISGAGYAGVSSYSILDNVIPFISGEEPKIESEPLRILGRWDDGFHDAEFTISAQTNRVPVIDGHMFCLSIALAGSKDLRKKMSIDEILSEIEEALTSFQGEPQELRLPSAPEQPIHVAHEDDRPQPRLDRDREQGMAVTVGRIRPCPIFDIRFVGLVHNTVRGAAGAAILNAELLRAKGYID
jgi:aspartate-semialdehyde dehydrogenase